LYNLKKAASTFALNAINHFALRSIIKAACY